MKIEKICRAIPNRFFFPIGISNGEIAAGVVGSLKPLYDIWGHAVNMASRMDSTGQSGKIQVRIILTNSYLRIRTTCSLGKQLVCSYNQL